MALALATVVVALAALIRSDAPTSPLPTAMLPVSKTVVATQVEVTPSAVSPTRLASTPTRSRADVEILAARRIEELGRDVGQTRELPKKQEIPLNFLDFEELVAYLRRNLGDSERRAFAQRQQSLLAALDLLPHPGEAFAPTVQARARQVIAFYDDVQEQLFIGVKGRDSDPPDISLVHQYAHAVIDQHFDLPSLATGTPSADAVRARDALVEGDAMVVLALHRFGTVDPLRLGELAEHLSEAELTDYEGYLSSRAMSDVVAFPYREGARFVEALLQAGWWPVVNAAYLDPPVSTEQILHPEKYVNTPRDEPQTVRLPDLREDLGEGWRLVAQDVLGELVLRAHLDQYLPSTSDAVAATAGWDGDLAAVWRDADGREVLVVRSLWDSNDEAAEFARIYVTVVDRRLRGARVVVRPGLPSGGHWWRAEGGNAYLQRQDEAVLIVWTPDTDTMERVLAVFVFGEE
jgi:hypothetical protein